MAAVRLAWGSGSEEERPRRICQAMNDRPSELQTSRGRFFFWLGVFVLPLFWSWFTLSKKFAWRERVVAFLWLAVFVAWLVQQRSALVERFELVPFVYPAILGRVGVALFVWLFFRISHFFSVTFKAIVFVLAVAFFGGIHRSAFFCGSPGNAVSMGVAAAAWYCVAGTPGSGAAGALQGEPGKEQA